MEDGGLGWLLEEFPWAHGRTTRAAAWTQDSSIMSVALGLVEGDEQRKCEECGQCPPALLKGFKCARCKTVYYCSRACQQKAWRVHKSLCLRSVADTRTVAEIVGLQGGGFAEEEACSWVKGKVLQWSGEDEEILDLVMYLECFLLAMAQAAEHVRIYHTATPANYLAELKRAGIKRVKGRRKGREEYPECFPDVIKLSLDRILQLDQEHAEDAGQALRKLALLDTEAIPLDLLRIGQRKAAILLQAHSLVMVDDKGSAAMHALTQYVVRDELTAKMQRLVLIATLTAVLAEKLGKFDCKKPATYFICVCI